MTTPSAVSRRKNGTPRTVAPLAKREAIATSAPSAIARNMSGICAGSCVSSQSMTTSTSSGLPVLTAYSIKARRPAPRPLLRMPSSNTTGTAPRHCDAMAGVLSVLPSL